MQPSNFNELLNWLAGAGGALILVSWTLSWGLEGWGKWAALDSRVKSLIILGVSLVIGLVSVWAMNLPEETKALIDPYIKTVLVIVAAWLTTQTAHRLNTLRK